MSPKQCSCVGSGVPHTAGPLHPYVDLGVRSPRVVASRAVEGALMMGLYTEVAEEVGEEVNEASVPGRRLYQKTLRPFGPWRYGAFCRLSAAGRRCGSGHYASPGGSRQGLCRALFSPTLQVRGFSQCLWNSGLFFFKVCLNVAWWSLSKECVLQGRLQ